MFSLHPQLVQDCLQLGQFPLCRLLLTKDANYPWFILVPEREGISEIYQLTEDDQQQLWRESATFSRLIMSTFKGDKLNIGALGNVVPQLHIHHIVRYRTDVAWPGPVWGKVPAKPYTTAALQTLIGQLGAELPAGLQLESSFEG